MLRDFFNHLYNENIDIEAIINAVQPEIDRQAENARNGFLDLFPITATEHGVGRWESIVGVLADPTTETLEFRRARILARLQSTLPFTEKMLQTIMDNVMGAGHWSYELDYHNYRLDITSLRPGRSWQEEMNLTLQRILPANLLFFLHMYFPTWAAVGEGFSSWQDMYNRTGAWQDIEV